MHSALGMTSLSEDFLRDGEEVRVREVHDEERNDMSNATWLLRKRGSYDFASSTIG
jgi:hypothetical protein